MRLSQLVLGADLCARAFDLKQEAFRKQAAIATRQAVAFVADEAGERTLIPKRINIQDSNAPRYLSQRKPIRTLVNESRNEGLVVVDRHWTPARTPAMLRMAGDSLKRRGLKIPRDSWIKSAGGRFAGRRKSSNGVNREGNYAFLRFSRHPHLAAWAANPARGRQELRHAIRISPDIGQRLITQPTVDRNRERIAAFFFNATEQVFPR